jgi:hypothetical protein
MFHKEKEERELTIQAEGEELISFRDITHESTVFAWLAHCLSLICFGKEKKRSRIPHARSHMAG